MAAGMELVRRASGLGAVEFIEAKLAELALGATPATTPIGAVGIAEFGILLGEADRALAEETAARIAARFEAERIEFEGATFTIIAHWGVAEVGQAAAPASVRHAADADQRARAAGPAPDPVDDAGEAVKTT